MASIVPKSKAKGVDFCGSSYYYYIIRSDLGCYLQSSDFRKGSDLTVFNLHPSCQNGDHYLANKDGNFYIIKGKFYRRVTDLSRDDSAVVASLHPNCQGGDNYLAAYGFFYIIFKERGVYRKTSDLSLDSNAVEYKLHPNCSKGLYYWGLPDNYYFLMQDSQWGVQYCKGSNFNKDECVAVYSVHPDVVNFLPGEYGGSHVNTEKECWNEVTTVEEGITFELKPGESLYLWQYQLGLSDEPVLFCRDLKINNVSDPPTEVPEQP
nr:uncharacterized protein LOC129447520 [Misgurnus anguillicaudatus]